MNSYTRGDSPALPQGTGGGHLGLSKREVFTLLYVSRGYDPVTAVARADALLAALNGEATQ